MIENSLACLPMRGQITRVGASTVELDVGTETLLIPGDKLQVFRREQAGWSSAGKWLYRLKHAGTLTITRSYPLGAIAKYNRGLFNLSPGDVVQAW